MKAKTNLGWVVLAFLAAGFGDAQPRPAFELASIRVHEGIITVSGGPSLSGTSVTMAASTVSDLIGNAYGLRDYQLAGVAEWMRSTRYDITARAAGDAAPTEEQARQMLRTLLADRFQLTFHMEQRESPVYALVIGKGGPKLKEDAAGSGIVKFNRNGRDVTLVFMGTPIDSLINQLPRMPGVDRPVIDKTALAGKYDFQLTLTDFQLGMTAERQGIPAADSEGASVFTALQDQLGLKLESQKAQIDVLVIDHVEPPSAN